MQQWLPLGVDGFATEFFNAELRRQVYTSKEG